MKNLLVLDKIEYKTQNDQYTEYMNKILGGDNYIIYTSYEDETIRKVRNYRIIGSAMQHILYWAKSYKYARKIMKCKYDVIYCINPIVGMFLGLFNKKSKIILCGFLFEEKKNKLYYNIRKIITKQMLKGIDKVVVYGSKEVDYYKHLFPHSKFVFVKYGIDYDNKSLYNGTKLPDKYLFSGGGSNRDYKTLISAYNKSLRRKKMVIATQPWRLEECDTRNIIVLEDVVIENFGYVLGNAECLILSLKDADISTGHMVMFQAMSLGIPIIVNDISAIRDYVDENYVTFYSTLDCNGLSNIIDTYDNNLEKLNEKAARAKELYNNEMSFEQFIKRIIKL